MTEIETILPARTFPFWFVFDRLARFWISLRGLATVSDPFSFSARTIRTKIFLFRPMGVSVVTIHYGRLNAVQGSFNCKCSKRPEFQRLFRVSLRFCVSVIPL